MKKSMLVFAVALLLAAFVPQQVAAAVDINFGVKAGVSLAQVKWGSDTSASSSLLQPVFGGFVAFNLNKSFAIQPEIYLLMQGGKRTYEDGADIYQTKTFLRYLHFPILAKLRLMKEGKFTPTLFAGPAVDVLLSAHIKYYTNGTLDGDNDVKQFLKSTNVGLVFGAGVEHMMDKLRLIFDVRYDMGLTNINNKGSDTLKLRALMFMVGVGF